MVVDHLLYMENAIKLHVQVDKIGSLLSETGWVFLCLLKPVTERRT